VYPFAGRTNIYKCCGIILIKRNIIRKRQAEGIAKAKERGVYENRTRKTTIDRDEVKRLKAEGLSTYKIADAMSISRMSVHRILNQSA